MGTSAVDVEEVRLAGLEQYQPQLQPFLAPGEMLHAVVSACLDSDIKDPPRKFQPKPSGLLGHLGGALERVAPFIEPAETAIDGIMNIGSGKVWGGGWTSQAGRLIIAAYPVKYAPGRGLLGTSLQFAVTDRRILVVYLPRRASKLPAGVLAEYGPGQLHNRPEPPPKRQKHRADLVFPDGSWIALQADSPQQADLLRHILSAGA
jgi:hypothetical protein